MCTINDVYSQRREEGHIAFSIACSAGTSLHTWNIQKNSILSLKLAPNLCERMEKNSILSLELAPKSWEDGNVWIFHVCRLVPEEAIEKQFNSRKVCNATLPPRTTWQQIISHNHWHVQNQTNCAQVYRRQGPKVAPWNNGSTFPSSSRTKMHCNSSGSSC